MLHTLRTELAWVPMQRLSSLLLGAAALAVSTSGCTLLLEETPPYAGSADAGLATRDSGVRDPGLDPLEGPAPYTAGELRLSLDVFYEGGFSDRVPLDGVTGRLQVFDQSVTIERTTERLEGIRADRIVRARGSTWGFGIHWDAPRDLGQWTTVHLSLKTDDAAFADTKIRVDSPSRPNGVAVTLSDYGFLPDGAWHHLSIPLADFAAGGIQFDAVTTPLAVIGRNNTIGAAIVIDNVFLTAEGETPDPVDPRTEPDPMEPQPEPDPEPEPEPDPEPEPEPEPDPEPEPEPEPDPEPEPEPDPEPPPLQECAGGSVDRLEHWLSSSNEGRCDPTGDLLVNQGGDQVARVRFTSAGQWHTVTVLVANEYEASENLSGSSGFSMTYRSTADVYVQLRPAFAWNASSWWALRIPSTGGNVVTRDFSFDPANWAPLFGTPGHSVPQALGDLRGFVIVGHGQNDIEVRGLRFDGFVPVCKGL